MSKNAALAAKRVAKKLHAKIETGRGPAVITPKQVVSITTGRNMQTAMRQLKGYRRRVYIAATDASATKAALVATKGTTIGVIDHQCRVCKPSTRKTSIGKRPIKAAARKRANGAARPSIAAARSNRRRIGKRRSR